MWTPFSQWFGSIRAGRSHLDMGQPFFRAFSPFRAKQDWRWGSLAHRREIEPATASDPIRRILTDGPVPLPRDWTSRVNRPQTTKEVEALRRCVNRGRPFGSAIWQEQTTLRLGLQSTFRNRGRPRKPVDHEGLF